MKPARFIVSGKFLTGTRLGAVALVLTTLLGLKIFLSTDIVSAQPEAKPAQSTRFRIGEKLSYNLSFGKFTGTGTAELHVISRGRLGTTDAVEIRSRIKTVGLVSAAFFLLDENRTVYASPDTGLPVYIKKVSQAGPVPKEVVHNYLAAPTSNFDLITLIYKAREAGGVGTFPLFEYGQLSIVTLVPGKPARVKTEVGEVDATMSTVQSEFLTAQGIKNFRIYFSTDENRIPVMIQFKTPKGEFRAELSAMYWPEGDAPAPLPLSSPTPTPPATTKPTPTPEVYVENRPLLPELGFVIGESLEYRVATGGVPAGIITLSAIERKRFNNEDSLLLSASVTSVEPQNPVLRLGDTIKAQVDPDTLAPTWKEAKFFSTLPGLNQTVTFNHSTGKISFGGAKPIDGPIGTHTLLSMIYAMRSFNLKPSKDLGNPVNDTRVAVFWESKPYIFILRPSSGEEITINGEKIPAQLITIKTNNKALDDLGIKVWLSTEGRVPLRFSAGIYTAELISRPATGARASRSL